MVIRKHDEFCVCNPYHDTTWELWMCRPIVVCHMVLGYGILSCVMLDHTSLCSSHRLISYCGLLSIRLHVLLYCYLQPLYMGGIYSITFYDIMLEMVIRPKCRVLWSVIIKWSLWVKSAIDQLLWHKRQCSMAHKPFSMAIRRGFMDRGSCSLTLAPSSRGAKRVKQSWRRPIRQGKRRPHQTVKYKLLWCSIYPYP